MGYVIWFTFTMSLLPHTLTTSAVPAVDAIPVFSLVDHLIQGFGLLQIFTTLWLFVVETSSNGVGCTSSAASFFRCSIYSSLCSNNRSSESHSSPSSSSHWSSGTKSSLELMQLSTPPSYLHSSSLSVSSGVRVSAWAPEPCVCCTEWLWHWDPSVCFWGFQAAWAFEAANRICWGIILGIVGGMSLLFVIWCYMYLQNAPNGVSSLGSCLVRLIYPAEDGKISLSLIPSSAGE